MDISADMVYPAAPEQVFAMLTDEEFQVRKCQRTGALNQTVHVTHDGGGATVVTKRTMSTEEFPDFAKSLLGETIIITETTVWGIANGAGERSGTLAVEIGSAPISLNGRTGIVAADDEHSNVSVRADLKAKLPFIGGKVEKAAEPAIRSAIRHEEETGHEWLGG